MASTLDLTPRASARGVGSNADPTGPYPAFTAPGQAIARAGQADYYRWLDHIKAAAGCTRPIRLTGTIDTVDPATGQRLGRLHTHQLPDAAIYKACGNRRATVCPTCAQTYQRDAYQLLRAGLVGGKGVPETVSTHPAVFATFTAPSFGTVHTRHVRNHTCRSRRRCDCRAEPCHARRSGDPAAGLCPHGNPAVCWARHETGDKVLGRPLCLDCYDHDHQVVWNLYSGELWHRTKQAAERYLAQLCKRRRIPYIMVVTTSGKVRRIPPIRLSPGKVAELQTRAAVHFHAIARLDGVDPNDPDAVVPPPAGITAADLDNAIRHAAAQIGFHTPPHPNQPGGWPITWGEQVDVASITADGDITDGMVAGYLAKYATKSTEVTGHTSARLDADTIGDHADPDGDHIQRLIDACWRIGRPTHTPLPLSERPRHQPACPTCVAARQTGLDGKPTNPAATNPYGRLRRWAHMLGYGGHFLTKARRYSVTFQTLRDTRVSYRREQERHHHQDHGQDQAVIRTADHIGEETTLTVGTLAFAAVGWRTTGDALLANTAAALARERQRVGREELAHELGSTIAGTLPAVA
jgi:hypothetical protein